MHPTQPSPRADRPWLHIKSKTWVSLVLLGLHGLSAAVSLISVPSLPRPASGNTLPALEQALSVWDRKQYRLAMDCSINADYGRSAKKSNGLYQLTYTVLLDTPDAFSVGIGLDAYCGGPYPVEWQGGLTFNPKTGARVDVMHLYEIAIAGPYGNEFKPQIRPLIRSALLARLYRLHGPPDCVPVIRDDPFQFLEANTLALGKHGLHVMYSAPHVSQACYGPVVLPYRHLQHFLNADRARQMHWASY